MQAACGRFESALTVQRNRIAWNIVVIHGGRKRMRTIHGSFRPPWLQHRQRTARTTQSTVLYNITKNDELQVRHHRASISTGREHHFEWGVGFGGGGGGRVRWAAGV